MVFIIHFHLIPGKIVKTGRHFEIQNGSWRRGWKKWHLSFLKSAHQN